MVESLDGLPVSEEVKHIPTKSNSNHTPGYLPEKNENLHSHKILYEDVYSSFMHSHEHLKQLGCPSTGERINELWSVYTVEYYPAIKRKEPLIHTTIWISLKCTSLNERSQSQKITDCMIPLI